MSRPEIESLHQLYKRPGFLLRRAHQLCDAVFESAFEDLELKPTQYSVLVALNEAKTISQNDIAKAIGINKVTVSQVVKGLAERGWLIRTPSKTDKRLLHLKLTAGGRRVLDRTVALAKTSYNEQMSAFDPAERDALCNLLERLVDSLEPYARTPLERSK